MERNVGKIDSIIRLTVATILIVVAALNIFSAITGVILSLVALVLIGTGVFGYCPPYALFGLSTCPLKSAKKSKKK